MATTRAKLSTTVDRALLEAVDTYVASHEDVGRGAVIDEALRLWQARQRAQAMEAQYDEPASPEEVTEQHEWRRIRRAAAALGQRRAIGGSSDGAERAGRAADRRPG